MSAGAGWSAVEFAEQAARVAAAAGISVEQASEALASVPVDEHWAVFLNAACPDLRAYRDGGS